MEQNNQSECILYVHNHWAEGMCMYVPLTHYTQLHLQQGNNTDSVGSSGCPATFALLRHQLKPSPCLMEQSTLLFFTVVMTITDFHKTYYISQ